MQTVRMITLRSWTDVKTRLCGFTLQDVDEKTFISSSNMLLVHMHTDDDKENRGFLAKHKGIKLRESNLERRNPANIPESKDS